MAEKDLTSGPAMQECGICSNGPNKTYHIGGPCPYAYPRYQPEDANIPAPQLGSCLTCADLRRQLAEVQQQKVEASECLQEVSVQLGKKLVELKAVQAENERLRGAADYCVTQGEEMRWGFSKEACLGRLRAALAPQESREGKEPSQ